MITFSPSNLLADGSESAVFRDVDNPNVVIAITSWAWYDMRHGDYDSWNYDPITDQCPKYQIFQKHPDLFPKVYDVHYEWVVLEKLDSERARMELEDIATILDRGMSYLINNYKQYTGRNVWNNETQIQAFERLKPYADVIDRVRKSLTRTDLKKLTRMDKMFDIHEENWGYDSQGVLKLLDL